MTETFSATGSDSPMYAVWLCSLSTPSACSSRVLGWTTPNLRDPAAADRWTWLIITCHAQLRLARPLVADLRLPWERPAPGRLTRGGPAGGFGTSGRPCPARYYSPGL